MFRTLIDGTLLSIPRHASDPEEVTKRWAKRLIEKDRDGETAVASKCTEQFEKVAARFPHFNPPYVDASLTAIKKGRLSLAKILISKEQNSARRVCLCESHG